jgi:NADH-quinone oxidoreductase subunit L
MNFFLQNIWLVPLLPLLGFVANGLPTALRKPLPKSYVHSVACGVMGLAFFMAIGAFFAVKDVAGHSFTRVLWPWITAGPFNVDIAFLIDPLSCVMMLIITGIGFLIHVYSIGYMHEDPSYARFFTYLNLFCFMMLLLVMGDNIFLLFVGWEGVGLCSYLLIGFWFQDKANGAAGMKAFIVNRVGDFGMMVGTLMLFWTLAGIAGADPTPTFVNLKAAVSDLNGLTIAGVAAATMICICLFIGATGKSAQIPLYVWLPDAMAGPTPVSALIHAATMVTAGVYLIARMNWLFTMSEAALVVVATVGALTAFLAATIGFAQNDIKKVLAYSTVSQLGFMFIAMGSAAYVAGVFHLMTHAFFKACLFLGSGSVIMGMHHEQDMRRMGGLRRYMPITTKTFLIATIAIAGVFPFSGFFSKDEILWMAFARGHHNAWYYLVWALGVVAAAGTAFYMCRLVMMTFFGEFRGNDQAPHVEQHHDNTNTSAHRHIGTAAQLTPHESPATMTIPLIVLAILSAVGGLVGIPYALGGHTIPNLFAHWLGPVIPEHAHEIHAMEYVLMVFSVAVAVASLYAGWWVYGRRPDLPRAFTQRFAGLYNAVANKYFVDEAYFFIIVRGVLKLNAAAANFDRKIVDGLVNLVGQFGKVYSDIIGWFDQLFVDGVVNGVCDVAYRLGGQLRQVQTGRIQNYAYVALLGVVITLIVKVAL